MPDGRSLYDLFGLEWTLLAFRRANVTAPPNLKILEIQSEEARDLYGADYALIRPDQIVAWRGNTDIDAAGALSAIMDRAGDRR